jgi:hypothetical protein
MAMILREAPNEAAPAAAPAPADPPADSATDTAPAASAADSAAPAETKSLLSGDDDETPAAVAEEPLTAESFTLPEGTTLDEAQLTPFLEIMNTADLTRAELAQKLVDYQVSSQTAAGEAADEAAISMWNDTQKEWQTEANALPTLGGAAMPQTLATIKKGLDTMGADKATYEALDLTGAGNHPAIVKILHALTKGLSETPPVPGSPPEGKLSQADRMYAGRKD